MNEKLKQALQIIRADARNKRAVDEVLEFCLDEMITQLANSDSSSSFEIVKARHALEGARKLRGLVISHLAKPVVE